jgi:hypothetical protein
VSILTETNFRISSIKITGALRYNTACHSVQLSGVITNIFCTSLAFDVFEGAGITHSEERNVENHEVEGHAERDGANKIHVFP